MRHRQNDSILASWLSLFASGLVSAGCLLTYAVRLRLRDSSTLPNTWPSPGRFTGVIPGLRASHSIASYVGALAFTEQRVLGTLSMVPKLAGRVVDARWDGPQAGAATAEISPTGLQLDLDVADVDPKFSGQLALHFKATIGEDVLSRLPRRSLAFDVPAEYVNLAVGVTYSP